MLAQVAKQLGLSLLGCFPCTYLKSNFYFIYSEMIKMVDCKNPLPGLDPTIAANLAAYGSPWGGAQRQVEKKGKEMICFHSQTKTGEKGERK